MKRLYKSRTNKVISGVCGGIAEYFGWDPSIVRLIWAAAIIFTAGTLALILYIICAVVLPHAPYAPDDFPPQDFGNNSN